MNDISNKAEQIIKGLIDANIEAHESTSSTSTCFVLKYENQEFDITLHKSTDKQGLICYFYHQIIKLEFPNER